MSSDGTKKSVLKQALVSQARLEKNKLSPVSAQIWSNTRDRLVGLYKDRPVVELITDIMNVSFSLAVTKENQDIGNNLINKLDMSADPHNTLEDVFEILHDELIMQTTFPSNVRKQDPKSNKHNPDPREKGKCSHGYKPDYC
jgi:hypothetical protein